MISNNFQSGDSCSNMTVYSECNTDRAELGSYSSNGTSNGYTVYTSDDGSLYKIYYDTTSSVMITIHCIRSAYCFLSYTVL